MNKRNTLFVVFICLWSIGSYAQGYYAFNYYMWNNINYHQNYKYQYSSNIDSYALANHIYKFTETTRNFSKKGKVNFNKRSYIFDKSGRCETRISTNDTGYGSKAEYIMKRSFNPEGQMSDNIYKTFRGNGFYQLFEYNDSNKVILATSYND